MNHRKTAKTSLSAYGTGSVSIGTILRPVSKVVALKGEEPYTVVEMQETTIEEETKRLGLPKAENYMLRDMLAAGVMPEAVSVAGMLDSNDPTDLSNVGVVDHLLDSVQSNAPKNVPEDVQVVSSSDSSVPSSETPTT